MVYRPAESEQYCPGDSYVLMSDGGGLVPMCRAPRLLPAQQVTATQQPASSSFDLNGVPGWVKWAAIGVAALLLLKR
jgi:hypothetical protein